MLVNIGMLGTGALATTLGRLWAAAGHDVVFAGRTRSHAEAAAAQAGALAAMPVLDCTNAVDFTTGRLPPTRWRGGEQVAALAPGVCGDDPLALERVSSLVSDLGGMPVIVGGLDAARQAEEVAGFVTRIALAGAIPRLAVPELS